MIKSQGHEHAATINALAERGIIKPVKFVYKGQEHIANSAWAATDWLKAQGYYSKPQSEIVRIEEA